MKWSITEINVFSTMLLFAINLLTQYLIDVALITFDLPYYFIHQYTNGANNTITPTKSSNIQTPPTVNHNHLEPVFGTNQSTPVIKLTEPSPKKQESNSESEVKGNFLFDVNLFKQKVCERKSIY